MNQEDLIISSLKRTRPVGQHVGYVSAGVRVEHIPTGIAVECDSERSQMRNREVCMGVIECWLGREALRGISSHQSHPLTRSYRTAPD